MIERNIPVDFLIYRPEEFDKRIQMGDPFLKAIIKEGKVLYDCALKGDLESAYLQDYDSRYIKE